MLLSEALSTFYVLPQGQSEIVDFFFHEANNATWCISWTDSETGEEHAEYFHDQEIQFGDPASVTRGEFFVINANEGESCPFIALDGARFAPERLLINLEGGLVQAVLSEHTEHQVLVVDYDTDGADKDEITEIPQGDGTVADACTRIENTVVDPTFTQNAFDAFHMAMPPE